MFRAAAFTLAAVLAAPGCAREKTDDKAGDQAPSAAKSAEATPTEARATEPTPEAPAMPAVGTAAPAFTTVAHDGTEIDVAKLRGQPFVLYFYPRDETPG